MVRVITRMKVKDLTDIAPVLQELRTNAMTYPGFVDAENLQGKDDVFDIVFISTWQSAEYWKDWETSRIRQSILQRAEAMFLEKPKATVYNVMPTSSWNG